MKTLCGIAAVGLALLIGGGCAPRPSQEDAWKLLYESEKATRQDLDTRLRTLESQSRSQPAPAPQPRRTLTRAETLEACRQLQAKREVPVECKMVTSSDGTQAMAFGFANGPTLTTYWPWLMDTFALDYCVQSNTMRPASSMLWQVLADSQKFRAFWCATGVWSDWLDIPHTPDAPPGRWR